MNYEILGVRNQAVYQYYIAISTHISLYFVLTTAQKTTDISVYRVDRRNPLHVCNDLPYADKE